MTQRLRATSQGEAHSSAERSSRHATQAGEVGVAEMEWREGPRTNPDLPKSAPFLLSVVIPTHRSPELARRQIRALMALPDANGIGEIVIVVDGVWGPEWPATLQDIATNIPVRLLVHETRQGAPAARNTGIRHSSFEGVLLLDSDATPLPGIIGFHSRRLSKPNVDLVVGCTKIVPTAISSTPNLFLHASLLYAFVIAYYCESPYWGPSCNISFKKDGAPQPAFDTDFPKRGGGEDVFFGLRIKAHGGRIVGEPRAEVEHEIWQSTLSICLRFFRWGWADSILLRKCKKHKCGTIRLRMPSNVTLAFGSLLGGFVLDGAHVDTDILIFPAVFFTISTGMNLTIGYILSKRRLRLSHHVASYTSITCFELGRLAHCLLVHPKSLLEEVALFPPEADIYAKARRRSLIINMASIAASWNLAIRAIQ